jgi:hypothetical protein
MHYKKAFPSNYLKAADVAEPATFTVKAVTMAKMRDGGEKLVVELAECKQRLVVNITNANRLGEAYGDDTTGWVGKKIVLYSERVPFGADLVDGIRVRIPEARPALDTKAPGPAKPKAKTVKAKAQEAQAPSSDPFDGLDDDLDGDQVPY